MMQVEIERLLQWTFCAQISKRARPGYGYRNPWASIEQQLRLGCSIDRSAHGHVASDIFAFPDADALVVAREVEKLNSNAVVDWAQSKDFLLGGLAVWRRLNNFSASTRLR